jgi:hypothetical protein
MMLSVEGFLAGHFEIEICNVKSANFIGLITRCSTHPFHNEAAATKEQKRH